MMGIGFLAGFLVIFNIVMWLVLLAKFRKFFTTDEIIGKTREQMNRMIADVDRTTAHDIDMIKQRLDELRALDAEVQRHITVARNELEKQQGISFAQKVQAAQKLSQPQKGTRQHTSGRQSPSSRAAERYMRTAVGMQSGEAYALTREGSRQLNGVQVTQGDLFDDEQQIALDSALQTPNTFMVEQDGTSYASVPVIGPEVTFAEEQIKPKKDFGTQVRELYDRGENVEQISRQLGRSITEVQFALDMGA